MEKLAAQALIGAYGQLQTGLLYCRMAKTTQRHSVLLNQAQQLCDAIHMALKQRQSAECLKELAQATACLYVKLMVEMGSEQ